MSRRDQKGAGQAAPIVKSPASLQQQIAWAEDLLRWLRAPEDDEPKRTMCIRAFAATILEPGAEQSALIKYRYIPYSVTFDGEWEVNLENFRAGCAADLPSWFLARMVQAIADVLGERAWHENADIDD
jgi:hypothetical protein